MMAPNDFIYFESINQLINQEENYKMHHDLKKVKKVRQQKTLILEIF